MRACLCSLMLVTIVGASAHAQGTGRGNPLPSALGRWQGRSLCLVRPSSCHDEVAVYYITPRPSRDSLAIDARKIVGGDEEAMGVLTCGVAPEGTGALQLVCAMPNGVWRFQVRGDSLTGSLLLPDHTRFRDVRMARAPKP